MKSILFSLIAFIIFSINTQGQNAQYEKAMKKALTELDKAETAEGFKSVVNAFERIAVAEEDEWLPVYYQSYAHMMAAIDYMDIGMMKDCLAHVAKARELVEKAEKMAPKESEIYALKALVYQGHIWEDPQIKGAQYTPLVIEAAEKAIALDPANPRGFYIKGQQLFFMPTFIGGGPEAALPFLEKAQEKYKTFEPASELHPSWGRDNVEGLIKEAGKKN